MRKILKTVLAFSICSGAYAQDVDSVQLENERKDLQYIKEIQDKREPDKVLHAEPLFIDLIRDLGARKGEREWNVAFGLTDNLSYDTFQALIEYEFAPVNRLGLEVEIPVTLYSKHAFPELNSVPADRVESFKTAAQWSFFVSQKMKTSLAVGYINELEFSDIDNFGSPLFKGNIYNPFFVAAKRFGNNWHTLLYSGPLFEQHFKTSNWTHRYDVNTNVHYMITGTRNFVGVEINKSFTKNDFDMVLRPQMRLGIADNFLIGIVGGIPINRENQRFSMFTRIIWEPRNKFNGQSH